MPILTDEERDRWLKREARKQRLITILFSAAGGILALTTSGAFRWER